MLDLSRLSIDRNTAKERISHRRWPWGILVALLILGLFLALHISGEQSVDTVSVTTAYPYQAVIQLNAAGYVVAQRKAAVASKATGRLEWLGVAEGSQVKAGEVIARLESSDVQAQLEQAMANVKVAQAELWDAERSLTRARELALQKFVSGSALDAAQARSDKAKAGLAVAQANRHAAQVGVDQTLIRAPFNGVVLTKTANVGDVITPFSAASESKGAVVTMADMTTLEVEADVSEANLGKIRLGQPCEIQLDAFAERRLRGIVSRIVPTVDRAKASVLVKVSLVDRDSAILPEMSAKVAFLDREIPEHERRAMTAVHQNAIVQRDGQAVLFLIEEGRVKLVAVKLGQKINDLVVLNDENSRLKAGDKAVLHPLASLRDGDKIKLTQK